MKFKIHFTIRDYEDYFIVEGTFEDIKKKVDEEIKRRNLDEVKNNCWSEEI